MNPLTAPVPLRWITCIALSLLVQPHNIQAAPKAAALDKYGGCKQIRREATGFFRVEQVNGRWLFITPEGHGYVALGANHVGRFLAQQSEQLLARFAGDRQQAEEALFQAMLDMGLNAGEAYAPLHEPYLNRLPHVANIRYPFRSKFEFDVFDPATIAKIHSFTVARCRECADNPWVLGMAFADLPVWNQRRVNYYRKLPPDSPGRRRYVEFLCDRYADIAQLNEAYGSSFASFDTLSDIKTIRLDAKRQAVQRDDNAFLGIVADTLYATLKKAVREGTPNHLFFGERFVLRLYPDEVLRAVGKHVDVFCTQALILSPQRPPEWQVFQKDVYDHEYRLTGKPMLMIDWAAPFSLDETYKTEKGVVKAEAEAADEAAEWLLSLFELPYMVGAFKCQLIGTHGNDAWFPEGRMKRTYLRDDGTPFNERTSRTGRAHREVLRRVYQGVGNASSSQPNVLLILADDLGYECLRCNGSDSYSTPHLDQLARTGVRFRHCYVNPICTPTRVPLMTGRYNFRNYTQFGTLPAEEPTFGHMMQDAGYATCIVEKWQLDGTGGTTPDRAGFDEYFMKPGDTFNYADPFIQDNDWQQVRHEGEYGPDLCVDYLCDFMTRHKDRPFFAYYPMALTHFPFKPTPDSSAWLSGNRHSDNWKKHFGDMVSYMDKIVGRLVAKLDALGIRKNTLVLFLGDNGTDVRISSQFRGRPYRGGKAWLTDAGTHVPMIVSWPGKVAGGRVLDDLVDPTDFLVTIADATAATPRTPPDGGPIDGLSFLPRLLGAERASRDWVLIELINEFRKFGSNQRPAFAGHEGRYVRDHRWKLYEKGVSRRGIAFYKGGQLYDLVNDPHERRPIGASGRPKEAAVARERLQAVFDSHQWEPGR